VRKTPAYALHAAWWAKDIILGTVCPPSDSMNDESVSLYDTVVIDQSVHAEVLGEILLREEYKVTLDVLKSWALRSPRNGLVVTGQPGIGKTYFLWYLLRYRLSQQLPTIFGLEGSVYFFHKTGAYELGSPLGYQHLASEAIDMSRPELVWSLIDTVDKSGPPPYFWEAGLFPVQTTSPDRSRYKVWAKQRRAQVFTMNPWDWNEILAGISLQPSTGSEFDLPLLRQVYYKYGPVPRNVYEAYLLGGTHEIYDQEASEAIADVSRSLDKLKSFLVSSSKERYLEISNKVVCLKRRGNFSSHSGVLSRYVLDQVLNAAAFATLEGKRQVCELFAGIPHVSAARGWAFEMYSHACLSGDDMPSFRTYAITPDSNASHKFRPASQPTPTQYPRMNRRIRHYRSSEDFKNEPASVSEYCIPFAPNNPCFDSFVVTNNAVYIFQMSISHEHNIGTPTQKGTSLLRGLVGGRHIWHYIMVVPDTNPESVTLTSVDPQWVGAVSSFQLMVLDMKVEGL